MQLHVLGLRHRQQVCGIYAQRIPALMVKIEIFGERAYEQLVRKSVCPLPTPVVAVRPRTVMVASVADPAVSVLRASGPGPAATGLSRRHDLLKPPSSEPRWDAISNDVHGLASRSAASSSI